MEIRFRAVLVLFTGSLFSVSALGQANLENPQNGAFESGVTVVSGWHCTADRIDIQFPPECQFAGGATLLQAASGTFRGDTQGICGDTDNGFALLVNYGNCGPGPHTIRALADGVQFAQATVNVSTFGSNFLANAEALAPATVVKSLGTDAELYDVLLEWQQSKQNFAIVGIEQSPERLLPLLLAISGSWGGTWTSPTGSGAASMIFGPTADFSLRASNISLTGTGCAPNAIMATDIESLDLPYIDATMADGSMVEFSFDTTETGSMIAGTFWFATGLCAGREGVLVMTKSAQ